MSSKATNHDGVLKEYLKEIESSLKHGHATEHTYRPALKTLLESITKSNVQAINEPKQIECGAPDFIVIQGTIPLGYVEAKDLGLDLDAIQDDEQISRYRESLANFILTDYLEFRWYLDGELRLTASLPRPSRTGRIHWDDDSASQVAQLLRQFIQADIPLKATPKDLATRMAGLARLIRELIEQTFKAEEEKGELHVQLQAFRKVLIDSLTKEQFADMYAQTLCYGLFAARCNSRAKGFTRQIAANALPKTNPFLRKLFNSIAGPDLDPRIAWAVDQLADMLARADIDAILESFGRKTRQEDPVVHFYETFLASYDQKLREARGVYYTPEPVVGYIVRSIDSLLKKQFKLPEGLAHAGKIKIARKKSQGKGSETIETHKLQILDPATGTGTFLYAVIEKIKEHFKGNKGAWPGYVAEHLLPRLFGFEILMAPYAVAHMKLGLELEQTGYDFSSNQRLGVYLTNSLEEAHELTGLPLFTQWLAEESHAASAIKRDAPVMVVLGNPPYSGHSSNKGPWIEDLMADYKQSAELKKPAQAKWLSDDYVKFIRFAQWRIEQTGYGVIGYVSNHGYLDNPTFMDMRKSLLDSFDEIYVLDLHGSSKKHEVTPDGKPDENVFDIQQGVSIGLFIRQKDADPSKKPLAKVFHADLYGDREHKYAVLDDTSVESTKWAKVSPAGPAYYFIPQDEGLLAEYDKGVSLRDIFAPNGDPAPGIVTTQDEFAISWSANEAAEKVERLLGTKTESEARELFTLCSQDQWRYTRAKQELADGKWKEKVVPILYRPFDWRWTVYDRNVAVHRRERISDHMLHDGNYALITARSNKSPTVDHFFVSNGLTETKCGERTTQSHGFPLWLYPRESEDLFDSAPTGKRPNIADAVIDKFKAVGGAKLKPIDIFAYIYAIVFSQSYRDRYADFLKRDFARIPITKNAQLMEQLIEMGRELMSLHTMETTLSRITKYEVSGTDVVTKPTYSVKKGDGRVYINAEQYFAGVSEGVWNICIGGYQVAEKWLKDRKGRKLSYEDITHYQSILSALDRTVEIKKMIDKLIMKSGGWPLK